MSAATAVEPLNTIAELLERLGDVPAQRVRLHPTPGRATEQDLIESQSRYGSLYELVDGTLVEKGMGYYESWLASILIHELLDYLKKNDLGIVPGEAGMVRVQAQVRMPDVAFYSWRHFPGRLLPAGPILGIAPDLAIEVMSPTNTRGEMARKRREYFGGGTQRLWEIFPPTRTAHIYTDADTFTALDESGTLTGEPVLPGFALAIRTLFERAGQRETAE